MKDSHELYVNWLFIIETLKWGKKIASDKLKQTALTRIKMVHLTLYLRKKKEKKKAKWPVGN